MRILILGGTSLTGPHAVRRLHSLGHDVTVRHRGEHEAELPEGVRHLHGDFADLRRETFDPAPDVVVHWDGKILEAPAPELAENDRMIYDFAHHIVFDKTRIRSELGYREVIPYQLALARTLESERAANTS